MSGARRPRTLPGFRFETKAPPLAESLPRMDVAVFIGFAASGPLQTPVALESEAQFDSLFGADAPLGWDLERGEQVYAYLAPAVRAFFRNGGQRCWVIRVARRDAAELKGQNRARYNYFPITGMARAVFGVDAQTELRPAMARARSEGSWSDSLSVSSALLTHPEQARRALELVDGAYVLTVARPTADEFAVGDLLRLTFSDNNFVLFLTVGKIEPIADSGQPTLSITGSKPLWFEQVTADSFPPDTPADVHVYSHEGNGIISSEAHGFETVYSSVYIHDEPEQPPTFLLTACPPSDAPEVGAVIRIDIGVQQLWMTVASQDFSESEATTSVTGQPFRWLTSPPALPATMPAVERVSFELWVRKAGEYSVSLSDLGFEARHERFWGTLPTDEALYQDLLDNVGQDTPATVLWRQVGDLFRFPLAGVNAADDVYFPLAMAAVPDVYLGPVKLKGSALQRDGLAQFDARLFMDRDLISVRTETLAAQAEFLQYLSPTPRRLTGMHAAWPIEEATIIAVPDAVHRGWLSHDDEKLPTADEPKTEPPPDWWHLVDCNPPPPLPVNPINDCDPLEHLAREEAAARHVKLAPSDSQFKFEPPLGNFLNCAISEVPAPLLIAVPEVSATGTFTLSWESSLPPDTEYLLQEATIADFNDAETVYSGEATSFTFYGRKTGVYFYRVRARVGQNVSDWSRGTTVRVASEARWALKAEAEFAPNVLLAVQRALLRFCAARGDLFGVLSLPVEYREDKAIEHVTTLKEWLHVPATEGVEPLGAGEVNDFSYGAVYHPWLINSEGNAADSLRRIPPCGAVSGVFAHRALTRGAWIAPANEPMNGIVALVPPIRRERQLDIQNAGINLVRQEPRGFIVLDSDTLSDDEDFRQINVRRLLILLRRQALTLGATYVFEPHSPAFRRLVERGFTGMLDEMFVRGAFAGSSPATAYQVVADESLNTTQVVDQGRFIVELKVAPSLPLTFLTIRFIQTGDRSFVTEVR